MSKSIKILIPGPLKFNFIKDGIDYYSKRINPFINFKVIAPRVRSATSDKVHRLKKEEEVLKRHLSEKDYLLVLDERGKLYSSKEFAVHLRTLIESFNSLTFLIGGAEGLSENLKRMAGELISLSKLTLNHEVALLVLLESIYRSFTIIKGHPYHRD